MDFTGKKILVIGLARSGMAAISVLHRQGAVITACDIKTSAQISTELDKLKAMGVKALAGSYPRAASEQFDLVVISPGVPLDIDPVKEAQSEGIPVIGEVELAYLLKPEVVEMYAITGTNGKTTTTSLLQCILAEDGRHSMAGGNIGVPLTALVESMTDGVIPVEVSSFQLETILTFKPHICGILNITPDHLDRHKTMQSYVAAKARVFVNQTKDDITVLNYEDEKVRNLASICPARVVYFSAEQILPQGTCLIDNKIVVRLEEKIIEVCPVDEVLLRGKHNLENVLCAVTMAIVAGVSPKVVARTLRTFSGVRHRMEEAGKVQGILYVNDSKATNPDSAIKALQSFAEPIILIAGGRNKGFDFAEFARIINMKVKELVLVGESREEIKRAVMAEGFQNIHVAEDFPSAVNTAQKLAKKGNVVLLSPACASWDMFTDYEQRGDLFCEMVRSFGQDNKS